MSKSIFYSKNSVLKNTICLFAFLLSFCTTAAFAQGFAVTGTVVDDGGQPLIGATVFVKGTNNGTVTDMDGNYSLNQVTAESVLVFSFVGFTAQEIPVGTNRVVNATMSEDSQSLEELVVVGYGVQKKALLTGATINVAGEDLQKMSTTNAFTALQNSSPGVTIMQANGQPGAGYVVNIRGLGTNGESRPLYVIDGVAAGYDGLNNMSVADIESIDILKDAASSAIYGARAANGVVLITTKQGKAGKPVVTYDGYYGQQYLVKKPGLMNAKEYMIYQEALNFSNNIAAPDWYGLLPDQMVNDINNGTWEGTDWIDAFYNKGAMTTSHSLNVTGGSEQSKFSLGYSYTSQDGIFGEAVQPNYSRNTFRINSDHVILRAQDRDIIKIGENINYMFRTSNGVRTGGRFSNEMHSVLVANPLLPAYDTDGTYFDFSDWSKIEGDEWKYDTDTGNPLGVAANSAGGLNLRKNHNLNASAYLVISPIEGLTFRSQYSYRMSAESYRSANHAGKWEGRSENAMWTVNQQQEMGFQWALTNTLTYDFSVKDHNIMLQAGQEIERSGYGESVRAEGRKNNFELGWDYDYVTNLKAATELGDKTIDGDPLGENAMASFFGRAMWNYKETYMLDVIMRADGSSRFGPGHQWGYFPSVSAGWILTNESFLQSSRSWMDYLKLRASWGRNGNAQVTGFQYMAKYEFPVSAAYFFGTDKVTQSMGSVPGVLQNPEITWETMEQTNIGFDSRFLRSRLGVTFDFYVKNTKDWLLVAPIAATWGYGSPNINGGAVKNSGVELSLSWNERRGDFNYGINLNGSYNKNRVTHIDNQQGIITGGTAVISETTGETYRLQVGQPMGFFYGWIHDGVFQNQAEVDAYRNADGGLIMPAAQAGDIRFRDIDGLGPDGKPIGKPDGKIDAADKTNIGCGWPIYRAGLSFNAGYKGFDLMIAASGAFGHQLMKSYKSFADRPFENTQTHNVFNRWTGEGTTNFYPRLAVGSHINYTNISKLWLESGNYVKIQNITLGYDLKRVLPAMPFSRARLYITGQNLFTFTKYSGMDPEIGWGSGQSNTSYPWVAGIDLGYYPSPKTYLMGISVTF